MNPKKAPSNVDMFNMLRSNMLTTDTKYDIKTFTLPLKVQDFMSIDGVCVSTMLHLAQGCSDLIHGIFYVDIVSERGTHNEAIVVLCKRKDEKYELRVAIKTRQAVGGVLECFVTADGATVSWPSDPFGLHVLIMSQYNEDTLNTLFFSRGGIKTPLSEYVQILNSGLRYGIDLSGTDDVSGLLRGGGTAYQWYDFLKWWAVNRYRDYRHVRNVRPRSPRL